YALGALLYKCLTGRPPFEGPQPVVLVSVQYDEPAPPLRLGVKVARDLETICLKCLSKEPARRYASAEELADDLRRFLASEPVRAGGGGGGEGVVGGCRRKPGIAGLLAALVLVFLAGSAGVLWQWQSARRSAAEARLNADKYLHQWETAQK